MALSSWLPKISLEGGGPTKAALKIPFWFYHGTDDKVHTSCHSLCHGFECSQVVKFELGCESYTRALQLGLRAQFKQYEGLGHEYGSQEMIDVQKFFFRRIPEDLADTVLAAFSQPHHDVYDKICRYRSHLTITAKF